MIKIYPKLWYIQKRVQEKTYDKTLDKWAYGDVTLEKLSYMTYYEDNAAFQKRSETGLNWAETRDTNLQVEDGIIVDNVPLSGFKVVESVSRWSTSNKLFRIEDPRGFIVEIPTGNLATLLNYTTVKNAVIEDKCVWGREGSNHILLPVGSEPYLESLKDAKTLKSGLIKPRELTAGDHVKIFNSYDVLYFAGRCRLTWRNKRTQEEVQDNWTWLFLSHHSHTKNEEYYRIHSPSVKIVEVIKNEPMKINLSIFRNYDMPNRLRDKFTRGVYHTITKNYNANNFYYGRSGGTYEATINDDFRVASIEVKS